MATEKKDTEQVQEKPWGRPPVEIDLDQLTKMMQMKPKLAWVAGFFKCSPATIELRIDQVYGCTFTEFRARNMYPMAMSLIKKATEKALNGKGDNQMIALCLKHLCDWKDESAGGRGGSSFEGWGNHKLKFF